MGIQDRFYGCLLGLACGDAVGTTVEFMARGSFAPVTDMVGGGPFRLARGEWTDDTSMALCLAASLSSLGKFDAADIMDRFCRWKNDGYLSSTGHCFDIGMTVSDALRRFQRSGDPFSGSTDPRSAGNGCLMRLAPIPMFYHDDRAAAIEHAALSARTTHGALECVEASRLFAAMLYDALTGVDKQTILLGHESESSAPRVQDIARATYRGKSEAQICGSGYVIESLEAALWCFDTTDSFAAAILRATNLGDDADTTAAICGQIAGAFYGESGIPPHWLQHLAMADMMRTLVQQLWITGLDWRELQPVESCA